MPPKILAIEGVGGVGKSRLVAQLTHTIRNSSLTASFAPPLAATLKRPNGARWEVFNQLNPTKGQLDALMDFDAILTLKEAATYQRLPWIILDRHWLSGVVYQSPSPVHADLHDRLVTKARCIGEPDVWVLLTSDADTIAAALRAREPDPARAHLDTAFGVAQALERQKQMINLSPHLKAPLLHLHRTGDTYQVVGLAADRHSLTEACAHLINIMQESM